jgi:hypothetical protein
MDEGGSIPTGDAGRPRVRWWPTKYRVRAGRNMADPYVTFTGYAWWQWRQRLRTQSVRNLERWYIQLFFFGRDDR